MPESITDSKIYLPGPDARPAELYKAACRLIAGTFEPLGYQYAASGPHMTRRAGQTTFRVGFQTSFNNTAGVSVELRVSADVYSRAFESWRESVPHPVSTGGWTAGGLIHLLAPGQSWQSWNLVNAGGTRAVIEEIINTIKARVLPYFAIFENPEHVITELRKRDIPAFDPATAVEYALCFGGREAGQAVLSRWLNDNPRFLAGAREARLSYEKNGYPDYTETAFAPRAGWVALAHGLELE